MEPALIALVGTIFGGAFIKFIDYLGQSRNIRKALNYNERWSNIDYVSMIHRTRTMEREELGEVQTECHCKRCKVPLKAAPGNVVGAPGIRLNDKTANYDHKTPEKKAIMFFPSGPKSMTAAEMREEFYKLRIRKTSIKNQSKGGLTPEDRERYALLARELGKK